jgi:hypothetical protein
MAHILMEHSSVIMVLEGVEWIWCSSTSNTSSSCEVHPLLYNVSSCCDVYLYTHIHFHLHAHLHVCASTTVLDWVGNYSCSIAVRPSLHPKNNHTLASITSVQWTRCGVLPGRRFWPDRIALLVISFVSVCWNLRFNLS